MPDVERFSGRMLTSAGGFVLVKRCCRSTACAGRLQLRKERLGRLQIRRLKPFREPTLHVHSVPEQRRFFIVENIEILREEWSAGWRNMRRNTQILSVVLATERLHRVVRESFFRSPDRNLRS
jgi:hypothetical protein